MLTRPVVSHFQCSAQSPSTNPGLRCALLSTVSLRPGLRHAAPLVLMPSLRVEAGCASHIHGRGVVEWDCAHEPVDPIATAAGADRG
jgi:hypothetical protein